MQVDLDTRAARFIEYQRLKLRMENRFRAISFESHRQHECDERGMVFEPSGPTAEALEDELFDLCCDQAEFEQEVCAPDATPLYIGPWPRFSEKADGSWGPA